MLDFKAIWDQGVPFHNFVETTSKHHGLWDGVHRLARVPEWVRGAVPSGTWLKFLVIAEDWCGDASNTIPVLAKVVEEVPGFELRLIQRDQHPDVMDRYLTNGSRSIPIVIVLDDQFREVGHWGPRPAVLQAWVMENRPKIPKPELYPQVRKWYARDHGESTVREVLEVAGIERGASAA